MFNLETKLEQFIQPVASCNYQDNFSVWISKILTSPKEMMVIVNDEQIPQGLVTKFDMLGLFTEFLVPNQDIASKFNNPDFLISLIQPISCLSKTTTIAQLLVHLKNNLSDQNLVVVDNQSKLLGLINISELIKTCNQALQNSKLSQNQVINKTRKELFNNQNFQFSNHDKSSLTTQKIINRHNSCNLKVNHDNININSDQKISFPLTTILDQVTLPLQIINSEGEVCYVNHAWRQTFGSIRSWENSEKTNSQELESNIDNQNLDSQNLGKFSASSLQHSNCSQTNNFLFQPLSNKFTPTNSNNQSALNLDQTILDQTISNYFIDCETQKQHNKFNSKKWHYHELPINIRNDSLYLDDKTKYRLILATNSSLNIQEKNKNYFSQIQTNLQQLQYQFFLNISHDLKSPLTSIIGLSRLLNEEKLGKLNESQMRYGQMIYHSGKKLINLINEFLSVNFFLNQKFSLDPEQIDLEELIQNLHIQVNQKLQATIDIDDSIKKSRSCLEVSVASSAQTIVADRVCLNQILTRIIENSISSCSEDHRLKITADFWSKKWLAISIWGRKHIAPSIQQAFLCQDLQSDRKNFLTSEENKQILDICLAQQLAKFHGGDISLVTQQNQSNKFTILLPQTSSRTNPDSSEDPQNNHSVTSHNLVIVFDNDTERILLWQQNLAELGYHLLVSRNTQDLIYKTLCFQPSSIIFDSAFLTKSSRNIIEYLASNPVTKKITFVYINRCSQSLQTLDQHFLTQIKQHVEHIVSAPLLVEELKRIFPVIASEPSLPQQRLTVMRLAVAANNYSLNNCILDAVFENPSFCLCHHIIEADSLEQAYLLARIWKIDAIIWDGQMLEQPKNHLKYLANNNLLAKIPIITLDKRNTAIANQIDDLKVFPCLLPAHERSIERLTQVIQIAAESN